MEGSKCEVGSGSLTEPSQGNDQGRSASTAAESVIVKNAQGILTNRYLDGIPKDSRAGKTHGFLREEEINQSLMTRIKSLNDLAEKWGMSLADLALNWVRSHKFITSVLVGVSTPEQLTSNLKLIDLEPFAADELSEINAIVNQN